MTGVRASATAFASRREFIPQPSRTTSPTRGNRGGALMPRRVSQGGEESAAAGGEIRRVDGLGGGLDLFGRPPSLLQDAFGRGCGARRGDRGAGAEPRVEVLLVLDDVLVAEHEVPPAGPERGDRRRFGPQ